MDGQRVAKHEGGSRLPWIIGGCAAGALAAAYIGLCVWAGGRDTILPNVSVAGVDVSNLTVEQARQALAAGYAPDAVLSDVEQALEALGELTGKTVREDVTDCIFRRFCVGK